MTLFVRKSVTYITYILFAIVVCACIILFLFGWGSKSYSEHVALSDDEKKIINELAVKCKCEVAFEHKYKLVNKIPTNDTVGIFKEDSLAHINLMWYSGKGHEQYNRNDDVYYKDSEATVANALFVARKLYSGLSFKDFYKGVRVYYGTTNVWNNEINVNERTNKYVDLELVNNTFVMKAFHTP